jgi:hypothetical protein
MAVPDGYSGSGLVVDLAWCRLELGPLVALHRRPGRILCEQAGNEALRTEAQVASQEKSKHQMMLRTGAHTQIDSILIKICHLARRVWWLSGSGG